MFEERGPTGFDWFAVLFQFSCLQALYIILPEMYVLYSIFEDQTIRFIYYLNKIYFIYNKNL